MKNEWIRTRQGHYMELIVPESTGIHQIDPPTYDEQIAASVNYMITVYSRAFNAALTAAITSLAVFADYLAEIQETLAIMDDPELMEAIREAEAESEAISRWEGEGGA